MACLIAACALAGSGTVATAGGAIYPVPSPVRVSLGSDTWSVTDLPCLPCFTVLLHLPISKLPSHAKITIVCHGSGCPFGRLAVKPKRKKIDLGADLKHRRLGVGTKISVEIAAKGKVTEDIVYTTRRGAPPTRVIGCLPAGAGTVKQCP